MSRAHRPTLSYSSKAYSIIPAHSSKSPPIPRYLPFAQFGTVKTDVCYENVAKSGIKRGFLVLISRSQMGREIRFGLRVVLGGLSRIIGFFFVGGWWIKKDKAVITRLLQGG